MAVVMPSTFKRQKTKNAKQLHKKGEKVWVNVI